MEPDYNNFSEISDLTDQAKQAFNEILDNPELIKKAIEITFNRAQFIVRVKFINNYHSNNKDNLASGINGHIIYIFNKEDNKCFHRFFHAI